MPHICLRLERIWFLFKSYWGIKMSELLKFMPRSPMISYPKLKTLSDTRKKAIKARLNTYSLDDFKNLFEKAEQSDFLKGKNDRNWIATFDWLIKDANIAKVLDGNYDNKQAIKKTVKNYGTVL